MKNVRTAEKLQYHTFEKKKKKKKFLIQDFLHQREEYAIFNFFPYHQQTHKFKNGV